MQIADTLHLGLVAYQSGRHSRRTVDARAIQLDGNRALH
jgi:hypothetical protein